jgi:hypothetical protein
MTINIEENKRDWKTHRRQTETNWGERHEIKEKCKKWRENKRNKIRPLLFL